MRNLFAIPTRVDKERRRRIKLAVWAYAYECCNDPLVSDAEYDFEAQRVDLTIDTGRPDLDAWFKQNFDPSTGMWVLGHPELPQIERLYREAYSHTGQ